MATLRIKELLKEKHCKGKELAERIGINRVTMVNIVNGKNNPSFDTLVKIADALEVPLWQLFASKEDVYSEHFIAFFHHNGESHIPTTMDEIMGILKAWQEVNFHKSCLNYLDAYINDDFSQNERLMEIMDEMCRILGRERCRHNKEKINN